MDSIDYLVALYSNVATAWQQTFGGKGLAEFLTIEFQLLIDK